ncbi:MAG TPA: DEAD/DEAH box helicase family protein [Spirochaetota bacterium]|nr:DEAD/DEAH box helicase family protein [Spirochaetota bacterium]HPK57429.1 DEAD/DEAH box helicase family protein [Spirochaetota bacterium]
MPDLVRVTYGQTGQSLKMNPMGMRDMQEKAYQSRDARFLLLKAPPASGKSRALMFLALDKLRHQEIKKVIVAVPERSIGGSFSKTNLKINGFFADWEPDDKYNLCTPGSDNSKSKVKSFRDFMESSAEILICTHATLRFACDELPEEKFNDCLLAIDEFHHVSADVNNRLGDILRGIMQKSTAHIIAMTGSYFRGDSVPVLKPEDEARFTKVTYNYYEQLNGYKYLKSLGIGYHFYQGRYTDAILEILDTDKKTILHIPNVNSGESTKDKHSEVDFIIDSIGTVEKQDSDTGVIFVKRRSDGKILKIADLVEDTPSERDKIVSYLRSIKSVDDMDLIIALGMAKEGFDWPYCEHALTVGYRGSLTEIIQIIGRATRDSENKTHAQFTNLIAKPEAENDVVKISVNNMLKAITASLLMEQVLAPNWTFRTKISDDDKEKPGEIKVKGFKEPSSKRVKDIIESDLNDLKATVLQDDNVQAGIMGSIDPKVMNTVLIPNVIRDKYPDLDEEQTEELRQYLVLESVIKNNNIIDLKEIKDAIRNSEVVQNALKQNESISTIKSELIPKIVNTVYPGLTEEEAAAFGNMIESIPKANDKSDSSSADNRFVRMADKFVNIDDIHIDLIDQVNPFQKAFEVISKSVDAKVLRVIRDTIESTRIKMDFEEARILWPKINEFVKTYGREPDLGSNDPLEKRMAECIIYLKEEKRKKNGANGQG